MPGIAIVAQTASPAVLVTVSVEGAFMVETGSESIPDVAGRVALANPSAFLAFIVTHTGPSGQCRKSCFPG